MNWLRACESSACIEVASDGDVVYIRTSDGPGIIASPAEWEQFAADVKAGTFDRLLDVVD